MRAFSVCLCLSLFALSACFPSEDTTGVSSGGSPQTAGRTSGGGNGAGSGSAGSTGQSGGGSGGTGADVQSLPTAAGCTTPFTSSGPVTATLTGPDLAVGGGLITASTVTFSFDCAASSIPLDGVPEEGLSYLGGGYGQPAFISDLTVNFPLGTGCPTLASGAEFDVSKSGCISITGGLNIQGELMNFNPPGATGGPSASGTFVVDSYSAQDGGTFAATFTNVVLPTTAAGYADGQLTLNGSYSASELE
ncbi:MAG TPA: hypothetical protein VMB50_22740 [Myxococcales bacterium]|nr:hypothetical protein [Myxococcales bacterium]